MPLSCQDLNSKRKFLPRYKKLYLKSAFNFNISNISQKANLPTHKVKDCTSIFSIVKIYIIGV